MIYLDTSALVKLVLPETESRALANWLDQRPNMAKISSEIVFVELPRAVARANSNAVSATQLLLQGLQTVPITPRLLAHASAIQPLQLRSLDAIHLASASAVAHRITAFVVYDTRLAIAAETSGLPVIMPS